MVAANARAPDAATAAPDVMLFGLRMRNIGLGQAADDVVAAAKHGEKTTVFFVNAHCVNVAAQDADYLVSLERARWLFADGSGMAKAARAAATPFVDNVNGTDLFPLVCERAARHGATLALIGAKPSVAAKCAENMKHTYPGLNIVYVRDGYFTPADEPQLIDELNRSGAQIVFVARGVPLQERWINNVAAASAPPVWLAVGALFDFYSGEVKRAPLFIRKLGLEWVFRLMLEPRRLFMRYVIGNPLFLMRMWQRRRRGVDTLRSARLQ